MCDLGNLYQETLFCAKLSGIWEIRIQQASIKLGRPLPSDCYGESERVLPRRPGGKTLILNMECSKP